MQQNYQTTKFPTAASQTTFTGGAAWSNPSNILLDDGNTSNLALAGSGAASLHGQDFGMSLPPGAVIDGISVFVDCTFQNGGWIDISLDLGLAGTAIKPAMTVNGTHGSATDLWGATTIDPADLANLEVTLFALGTVDDNIYVDYLTVTVYWHIDLNTAVEDVPTRVAYKVYSRDGKYLGELPNVTSMFGFSQDINSAGSSIEVVCGQKAENITSVDPILTESSLPIQTESDLSILATSTDLVIATGASVDDAIFKNSNRIKVWIYNYWYPNGKLMFSGQVNKVSFQYGGDSSTKLTVFSDGLDLSNYIARGYPFSYTTDVTQSSQNGYVTVSQGVTEWQRYGQTWLTGGSVTNVGAITLKLLGAATVTLSIYDGPNGNFIGSITKSVSVGSPTDIQFEYAQLLGVASADELFMAVSVAPGQSIQVYYHGTSSTYADGSMYSSTYAGGSGGGSYSPATGDLYFITKSGVPTTTTTYSTDDPVTDMMAGILLDYNARGGYITERDFLATGLSLTYTFSVATIFDALIKILELSPTGYYSYIDLGTAEMDIQQMSEIADFTIVRGKDINSLDLTLSIEQVKNYLLFTGGDTGGGVNLYRDYQDTESTSFYGARTVPRTDNRVTLDATADAIGSSFIEQNASETQETKVTILANSMDTTLLTPGKTIQFRNFSNFMDGMVLQIARRDFSTRVTVLTLGRLPVRMNDEIQRINRGLLNEQTIDNPTAPS